MKELHEWIRANEWIAVLPIALIIGYQLVKWEIESKRSRKAILKMREETGCKFIDSRGEKIEFFVDKTPTKSITFGRKIDWIAIKSENHEAIVIEFRKPGKKFFRTNLESGVYAAFALNIFVCPPIQGWILVLNPLDGLSENNRYEYLKKLSEKFGEVQFFGSFRGVGYSSWMKFLNGKTIRAYSVVDGEIFKNEGELTEMEKEFIEKAIRTTTDDEELEWIKGEGKLLSISDEENVLKMAEYWSINPDKLDEMNIEGLGTIMEY
jgi:hypothetical protein